MCPYHLVIHLLDAVGMPCSTTNLPGLYFSSLHQVNDRRDCRSIFHPTIPFATARLPLTICHRARPLLLMIRRLVQFRGIRFSILPTSQFNCNNLYCRQTAWLPNLTECRLRPRRFLTL